MSQGCEQHTSCSVNHSSPDGDENEKKDLERQSIMAASDDLELADSDDEEAFEVIDDYPNGYPRLAALLNSDETFLICRKYEYLHTRVLLYQQDELRELENKLLASDKAAGKTDDIALRCRKRRYRRHVQETQNSQPQDIDGQNSEEQEHNDPATPVDRFEEQRLLIKTINKKLKEYHDIVQRTRSFAALPRATKSHTSVWNWIYHTGPLVPEDASTFDNGKDFVAMVDVELREGTWMNSHVEEFLARYGHSTIGKLFLPNSGRNRTRDKDVRIYSKRRIDFCSRLLIAAAIFALLLAPVAALYGIRDRGWLRILIIFVFTLVFIIAMNLGTRAKRHEVLAATATYCAVLVVFLGNV